MAIKRPIKRREFPENLVVQPVQRPTSKPIVSTKQVTIKSHVGSKAKFKAVVTQSRQTAIWQQRSIEWTLAVDTPGGHAPFIVIVRGVEVQEDSVPETSRNRPTSIPPYSQAYYKEAKRPVHTQAKLLGDLGNSAASFDDDCFKETTATPETENSSRKGDDSDFDLDEADDTIEEGSLPSESYLRCSGLSHLQPPQSPSQYDLSCSSDSASIGDNDSTALRMKQLLDAFSETSYGEEDSERMEFEGVGGLSEHSVNHKTEKDIFEARSLNTSNVTISSTAPPRRPMRTVSKEPDSHKTTSWNGLPSFHREQAIQKTLLCPGVKVYNSGSLQVDSGHSSMSGDDTIVDSQILPLSNLADQPWASGDEDSDSSTSSEEEDSSDDYDSEDDESEQVRKYVEQMEMTRVDKDEVLSVAESGDDMSIMEYYQRDRLTAMILAMNAQEDERSTDHFNYIPGVPQTPRPEGQAYVSKHQFDVEMSPCNSALDESITFHGSERSEEHSLGSSVTLSLPGSAFESPVTVSTKESSVLKLMSSLPSIDENFLWQNNKEKHSPEKNLGSIQESTLLHEKSPSTPDGQPKLPRRSLSMNSDQQRLAVESLKKTFATLSPGQSKKTRETNKSVPSPTNHRSSPSPSPRKEPRPNKSPTATVMAPSPRVVKKSPKSKQREASKTSLRRPSIIAPLAAPNTPLSSWKGKESSLAATELGVALSAIPSPNKHSNIPEIFQDSFASSGFMQLDIAGSGGVKKCKNAEFSEMEMPELDDFREQEIPERQQRRNEKPRGKRKRMFGVRRKDSDREQLIDVPPQGGSTLLDNLWNFGPFSSHGDMAKAMSDMTAYAD